MTDQKIMHRSLLKAGLGEVGPAELAGGERPTFLHVAAQRTSEGWMLVWPSELSSGGEGVSHHEGVADLTVEEAGSEFFLS